jgi:hypothetical protein
MSDMATCLFTDKVMAEAEALLKQAVAAAPDGPYRRRVELFRKGFDEAKASLAEMRKKVKSP